MTPNPEYSANSLQFEHNIIKIDCLYVAERPELFLDRFPGLTLCPPGIVCALYGAYGFTPLYKIRARAKKNFRARGPNLRNTSLLISYRNELIIYLGSYRFKISTRGKW